MFALGKSMPSSSIVGSLSPIITFLCSCLLLADPGMPQDEDTVVLGALCVLPVPAPILATADGKTELGLSPQAAPGTAPLLPGEQEEQSHSRVLGELGCAR